MSALQIGDVFFAPDGTRITINRCARDGSWADITVTQPHGASWRKRQPLRAGRLPFDAVRVEELAGDPR